MTSRRRFLQTVTAAGATAGLVGAQSAPKSKLLLGLDAHSMRGMKWHALEHIEYARKQKLDAVLLNGLHYFKSSLDAASLANVKEKGTASGLRLHIGVGGISEGSKSFKGPAGSAEATLAEGVRVAVALGSPTVNCRIGNIEDRYTDGGIEARLAEAVKTLKAVRTRAQDAGVKFAFENHAGDTRSEEILALIEAVGADVCGVMLDPGNAVWAMEDPIEHLLTLAPHVLCTSIRDYMLWESEEGATFQWTAVGEGMMNAATYVRLFREKCPGVPFFVETISNSQRPIPFLSSDFWDGYPNLPATELASFIALCRRGHAIEIATPPAGADAREFDRQHQRAEFEKSIAYLRSLP